MKYFSLFLVLLSLLSCSNEPEVIEVSDIHDTYSAKTDSISTFKRDEFNIQELPFEERVYTNDELFYVTPEFQDDDSIVLHVYREKYDYHPVMLAAHALKLLDVYRRTQNDTCLRIAKKHADKLLGIGLAKDSALLFPYSFNYHFNDKDMMFAPWVSGMAQGKILSLFSRLYTYTKNDAYLEYSHKIFKSFTHKKGEEMYWITCVDTASNLWIEEYPFEEPSHIFNGMVFAIFGVYDYYLIHKTPEVKVILDGAITTVKDNMALIRNKDNISYYGLKYITTNPNYHPVHIEQLKMLSKITDDTSFEKLADLLVEDEVNFIKNQKKDSIH